MTEYLKVTVTRIREKKNSHTKESIIAWFNNLRELHENTDGYDIHNIIVEKNWCSVVELISKKELFVVENEDDEKLKKSLQKLQHKLFNEHEVFIVFRSSISNNKENVNSFDVRKYFCNYETNYFYRFDLTKDNNEKPNNKPYNVRKLVKQNLRRYREERRY